jgi:hypothetical protein
MAGQDNRHQRAKQRAWRVLVAAVAAAPLLASAPAAAQWSQWFGDGVMPPRAIGRIVMREGFSGFSPPRLAGDVYIVHAIDEDGERVRLVIDAYDGRILRPVRRVERLAPSRPLERVRPRDEDDDIEREDIEPRRPSERDAFLPPRPVPRVSPLDDPFSREARIETPSIRPEPQPAPSAKRPDANRRASRLEPPARESAPPTSRAKQRDAVRPNAGTTPAAPPPVVGAPKPDQAGEAQPSITAAVPTPAAPKEMAPASPAAPAAEPARRPDARPASAEQPPAPPPARAAHMQPAAQPAATASASGGPVRVIEGVTPILPQDSATPEK